MTAWKKLELRTCRLLGGERRGPTGHAVSDCVGTRWAVSIKRSKSSFRVAWIEQAREFSRRERKPWLLVVARHQDRKPIVALDLAEFLEIAHKAGLIPDANAEEMEAA